MKKNKFALLTGAAGFMGVEHAKALVEIGYNLVLLDLNFEKLLILKKKLLKIKKIKILIFKSDIRSETEIFEVKKKLLKKKIFVSCLINNADLNPPMNLGKLDESLKIEDYSIKKLNDEISVGILGTFNCCKMFGGEMAKRREGIIINISSDLGIIAPDQRIYNNNERILETKNFKPISYSISKHAINSITKYLATYWAHKNVRINTLIMGPILNKQKKFLIKNLNKRIPLNRMAKKNEFRKAIQFLASNENSYMTGQSLIIDGGRTIW